MTYQFLNEGYTDFPFLHKNQPIHLWAITTPKSDKKVPPGQYCCSQVLKKKSIAWGLEDDEQNNWVIKDDGEAIGLIEELVTLCG